MPAGKNPVSNEKTAVKVIYFSLLGNTCLALIKWCAGYFGNSYALIADAIESTTDIFSSLLVLFGLKYANRPPDANHPYGHGRAEPLITFAIVGFLIISAGVIAYTSIINITTPHEMPEPFTLLVLGPIIIWKEISYRYMNRKSNMLNSSSLKSDAWHHRSDAITSLAAFAGISIALIAGKGYESADDWAALFSSGIILYNSYRIFRPALGEIMDEHLYDDLVAQIRRIALTVEGITGTEKCYIRKSGLKFHVDLHATVDPGITVEQGHHIAHMLQDTLKTEIPPLGNVLIHIEPAKQYPGN